MNNQIQLGHINRLRIDRDTAPGFFLVTQDGSQEILLPGRYITKDMRVGDEIDVFVYADSEDRPVATTERPIALADEFGCFEVVEVSRRGVFVDWGLQKDLFVPTGPRSRPHRVGEKLILRVICDEQTNRLIGVENISHYIDTDTSDLKRFDEVELLVWAKTPLGYKVIVNNELEGMVFENDIFEEIRVGDRLKGYARNIRTDGKLDISLSPSGELKKDTSGQKVLDVFKKQNKTFLPYNYKSEAEEISKVFGLSKKNFKLALTKLQADLAVALEEGGIRLL